MLEPATYFVALIVGTLLTYKGSDILEEASLSLALRYRLPPIVTGSLVVAVGSSFPELAATVTSTLIHGAFELGMATIVGSAVFNILVIPGLSRLLGGPMNYDIRVVYRDAQFYLTSVAVLLIAFSFAIIYEPAPNEGELTGHMTRSIALIPLALYGLYLFLQHQEARGAGGSGSQLPSSDAEKPEGSALKDWLLLIAGLALVLLGVEALLRTAIWLGEQLNTPSFIWGATVVAAATSIPDCLISIHSAKRGDGDVSLGNVLGSNVFDLLVAVPAGVMIAGTALIDFRVAAPLMAFLTFATIVLFAAMRLKLELSRGEAWLLLLLYVLFVTWLTLETLGVMSWIPASQ